MTWVRAACPTSTLVRGAQTSVIPASWGSWVAQVTFCGVEHMLMERCFSFRIGRVAGRLPQELADDVLGSVLDCFRYVCMWKGPGFWLEAILCFLPVELFVRAPEFFLSLK